MLLTSRRRNGPRFGRSGKGFSRLLAIVSSASLIALGTGAMVPSASAQTSASAPATSATASTYQPTAAQRAAVDTPRGIVYRRGAQPALAAGQHATSTNPACPTCSPPLVFSPNNPVAGGTSGTPGHVTITPVFWAPTGYSFNASYKTIIDGYLANVAADSGTNSNVFGVAQEFYQQLNGGANQYITYHVTAGAEIDVTDTYPTPGCTIATGYTACVTDAQLQTEVANTVAANNLTANDSNIYMFFFPPNVETCMTGGTSCSSNVYCGYHGGFYPTGGAQPYLYANMPYPNLNGCSGGQSPNGDPYADAQVSIISHEANETITDYGNAWRDSAGYEDGDECAYTYGTPLGGSFANGTAYNQTINGTNYYTQDEFSNLAYAANIGDPTSPGGPTVLGCIQRQVPPAFTADTPPTSGTVGTAYTYTFAATGTPPASYSVSSGALPTGLTLNTTTGVLSGTPTAAGPFTFQVTASNFSSPAAVSPSTTVTISPTPTAPAFTADTPPTTGVVGTAYTYTFAATGSPAPTYSVSSGAPPPGLTLNTTTGVLSGTPTTAGPFTFQVTASNGVNPAAVGPSTTVTISAAPTAPAFTADTPPTTGVVGTAYTYTYAATGSPAPTYVVSSGALPPGLSLNGTTGVLSGTPTTAGPFTFQVTASNGVGTPAVSPSTTVTISATPTAPAFTADTPPLFGVVGTPYSYTFTASGNPTPTFAVTSGALPGGLTLNSATGVLSGTPTTAGPFTFQVTASNGVNPAAVTPNITIAISATPAAPAFTAETPPTAGVVGTAYSYLFAASGSPAPTFSVTSGTLPGGLTLNSASGLLSGTPTTAGPSTFQVTASNGVNPAAVTPNLTVTISAVPTAPAFTADTPPTTATVGTLYVYPFAASGSPAPTFTVSSGTLPLGLSLNSTTGVLSGTPTTVGPSTFQVTASNGVNPPAVTLTLSITVSAAPPPPPPPPPPTLTPTSVVVSGSPNPATTGQAVVYTATVSPTPNGGTVSFVDGSGNPLPGCSAVAVNTSNGQATCTDTYTVPGVYGAAATYSGDSSFAASSQSPATTETVNAAPPGTPPPGTPPPGPPAGGPSSSGAGAQVAFTADRLGWWVLNSNNTVSAYGDAVNYGSTVTAGIHLNQPAVGMAATPDGHGYWIVTADGGVFSFGDAQFFGSLGNIHLNKPIVGIVGTPDAGGYWLVASDGGVFEFGDAQFFGSTGNVHLNKPVVGMTPTPDGGGYWLVASDGGVFEFGDAAFYGSTGNVHLNEPIVGITASVDGHGYWLVASDGGVFDFGDAGFFGSAGSLSLNNTVVGMAASTDGQGYTIVTNSGKVYTYGDAVS